ncbi:plasmid recombination protein [Citromicrobium bathyomarinum]
MTEKPHYAIMRIGKIHTRAMLDKVEWHNTRKIPARTAEGAPMPEDWIEMTGPYRDRADKILEDTGATHDEGKILAVEVLVTTSPGWWVEASEEQKQAWFEAQYAYAKHIFGPGLLAFTPHLDESTPHVQFIGLPLYRAVAKKRGPKPKDPEKLRKRLEEEAAGSKIWRLSHDALFGGGPVGLAKRQTEYQEFVSHLGLCRGSDTVGRGVRHVPLKDYARLLTQEDRELKRQAGEAAKEQSMLKHYDEELARRHAEFRKDREAFAQEQLELYPREVELIEREEKVAALEASLDDQRAKIDEDARGVREQALALDQREARLNERAAENERKELEISAKQAERKEEEARLEKIKANLESREASAAKRELEVSDQAERNAEAGQGIELQRRDLDLMRGQISILTGVMTGRLTVDLDTGGRPVIAQGEPKPEEAKAALEPWPAILRAPLRRAAAMHGVRKKLAEKILAIRSKIRIRKREAEAAVAENLAKASAAETRAAKAERDAQGTRADAAKILDAAQRAMKNSEQRKTEADHALKVANERMAEADRVEAGISEQRIEKGRLDAEVSEAGRALREIREQMQQDKAALARLAYDKTALQAEKSALVGDRQRLQAEVGDLKGRRHELAQERAKIEVERAKITADRTKWDRSMRIWNEAVENEAKIEKRNGNTVIAMPGKAIPTSDVEPSVVMLVQQRQALADAMNETEELAASLDKQKREFAERHPEQKRAMDKERAEDKRRMQDAWARIESGETER